jgi:hypothetical protein
LRLKTRGAGVLAIAPLFSADACSIATSSCAAQALIPERRGRPRPHYRPAASSGADRSRIEPGLNAKWPNLKAALEKLPAERREQLERELEKLD